MTISKFMHVFCRCFEACQCHLHAVVHCMHIIKSVSIVTKYVVVFWTIKRNYFRFLINAYLYKIYQRFFISSDHLK